MGGESEYVDRCRIALNNYGEKARFADSRESRVVQCFLPPHPFLLLFGQPNNRPSMMSHRPGISAELGHTNTTPKVMDSL